MDRDIGIDRYRYIERQIERQMYKQSNIDGYSIGIDR